MSQLGEFLDRLKAGPSGTALGVDPRERSDWTEGLKQSGVVHAVSAEVLQALRETAWPLVGEAFLARDSAQGWFVCFPEVTGGKVRFLTEEERQKLDRLREEESPTLISTYSRAQALADGVLVDVSELAHEAGFRYPVAMTAAVRQQYVVVPPGVTGQDETGRCWDVLRMLFYAIRQQRDSSPVLEFPVFVRNSDDEEAREVMLKALCGPGDDLRPVITILLVEED